MVITILATIVVLGVLILVHELGHFLTAKAVDIEVPRFSIGLGPKMIGFRRGETEYVLSWLPFGGYVRMAGMEEMESIEGGKLDRDAGAPTSVESTAGGRGPRTFDSKSLPARALVISAGVIMNFLFAIVVFAAMALVWGVEPVPEARLAGVVEELLPESAAALRDLPVGVRVVAVGRERVEDWRDLRNAIATAQPGPTAIQFEGAPAVSIEIPAGEEERANLFMALEPVIDPVVSDVEPESPAARAGLRPGDRIVEAAGRQIVTWQQLVEVIQEHPNQTVDLRIERDGAVMTVPVVPATATLSMPDGETREIGRIGVAPPRHRPGPVGAAWYGLQHTWEVTTMIVGFLGDLVTGNVSPRNLGGPILIGQISGQVARAGLEQFLNFMALFSVNLAVLNLLPVPILDGGQLLFLAVEAVRGRALSVEARMRLTQAGLVLIVALMVWALASDVLRLFGL